MKPDRKESLAESAGSAQPWQCDLGDGEWDHDWKEKHDDAGEVDGIPGNHWSWRECRVCGAIEGDLSNRELSAASGAEMRDKPVG